MKRNEYRDVLAAEIERAGITDYTFEYGGKHPCVLFEVNGVKRKITFPKTPSDSQHGLMNAVSGIRKTLGTKAPKRAKSTRAPAKRIRRSAVPTIDGLTLRPDPFACLALWKPPKPRYPVTWTKTGGKMWRVEVRCQGGNE